MTELSSAGHSLVISRFTRVGLTPMRILVIEDEARILSFLARGLEAEGYSVEGVGDGRAGLSLALR